MVPLSSQRVANPYFYQCSLNLPLFVFSVCAILYHMFFYVWLFFPLSSMFVCFTNITMCFVATYYYIVWIPHRLPTLLLENCTHLGGKLIALLQGMCTSLVAQTRKESACNMGSIPGLGRSPGEGNSYPVQYSCLENSWQATVHGVTKSHTRLSDFHSLSGHVTGSRISGSSSRHMTRFSG